MKNVAVAIAAALALPACMSEVQTSSATYLDHSDSGAELARPALDSAREVTRLLAGRGFSLLDQTQVTPTGVLLLKYGKGGVALPATRDDGDPTYRSDVGSVIYAWLMPEPAAQRSQLAMIGKPTLAGAEPCSANLGANLPCQKVDVSPDFARQHMSGELEAATIHGVLAELKLDGLAVGPLTVAGPLPVPPPPPTAADAPPKPATKAECVTVRTQILAKASVTADLDERHRLEQLAPSCDAL